MNTTLKKRSFSLFLSFLLILCSLPFAVFTASAVLPTSYNPFTEDGSGTAQNNPTTKNPFDEKTGKEYDIITGNLGKSPEKPFVLDSLHDLDVLSAIVNGINTSSSTGGSLINDYTGNVFDCFGYFFKLSENFKNNDTPFINRIGWYDNTGEGKHYYFKGSFDGSNRSIHIKINISNNYVGLFGEICFATVKNLTVEGTVKATSINGTTVGGIVGFNDSSIIINCCNNSMVTGHDYVGGIVGKNQGVIANCINRGIVVAENGYWGVGGIAGYNLTGKSITNCYNTNLVTANNNNAYVGGVIGWNTGDNISYCYYDKTVCQNAIESGEYKSQSVAEIAIGSNSFDTGNVKGLPTAQCKAPSGADLSNIEGVGTIDEEKVPLIDAINGYVTAYNAKVDKAPTLLAEGALGTTEFTIPAENVIEPSKLKGIKLRYWDKQTGDYYPHLSKASEAEPLTSVNVNMFLAKPAIGCRLLRAKAFSPTKNVRVTHVRTSWFDSRHRIATKAHLGGKYTAMVSFKLDTAEEYDIAEGAKVWVRLNGKRVRATKRGDTYTVACSFKKLSICNVLSDIYKNLFWRIF